MNAHHRDNFEDTDTICLTCLIDEHLRQLAQLRSRLAECCVCESTDSLAIQIGDLAEIVDTTLRRYFTWGDEVQKFRGDNDDTGWTERRGHDMEELFDLVLPANFPIPTTLLRAVAERDPNYNPQDIDDTTFWPADMRYQEIEPDTAELDEEWIAVDAELQYARRFFSSRAGQFFAWIFDGLEDLCDVTGAVVIQTLRAGSSLYRARACDDWKELQSIANNPETELGAPPAAFAKPGRMNAAGVPVFYGAFERDTCISELRAPLKGQLAVGQFCVSRDLVILDFRRLENARFSKQQLSYFRQDYTQQKARRSFTAQLHRMIRSPVIPGKEARGYLMTQAMAEYLAYMREQRLDGLIFRSAQHVGGTNIVLFAPNGSYGEEVEAQPLLRYVPDSVTYHEITDVKYVAKDMVHLRSNGKTGGLIDPMLLEDER